MPQRDLRKLGRIIAQQRKQRGLSLRDVEKRTGITNSTLSRLELGEVQRPHAGYLTRLAHMFGVPASTYYLLAGYDPQALPDLKQFLCIKYRMSDEQAEQIDAIVEALREKWGEPN
jgi:transcriptional regulator with XRE-family HTH domain